MPKFRVMIRDKQLENWIGASQSLSWFEAVMCKRFFSDIIGYPCARIITEDALIRQMHPLLPHNFTFDLRFPVADVFFLFKPWFCKEDECHGR